MEQRSVNKLEEMITEFAEKIGTQDAEIVRLKSELEAMKSRFRDKEEELARTRSGNDTLLTTSKNLSVALKLIAQK